MKYLSSILVSNNIQTNRIKMDRNILMTSLCVADNGVSVQLESCDVISNHSITFSGLGLAGSLGLPPTHPSVFSSLYTDPLHAELIAREAQRAAEIRWE